MRSSSALITAIALLLLAVPRSPSAEPLTSSFSYRGYIEEQGTPVNGFLDLEFELFDALENGTPLAQPLTFDIVGVEDGEFTIALDFGDAPFIGERVWLEVRARPGGTTDPFTTLSPRQELRAVPYATHAQFVGASAISSSEILDGSIQTSDLQIGSVTNSIIAPGTITQDKLNFTPGDISEVVAGNGLLGGAASGTATLSLDPSALPPATEGRCESPEVMIGIQANGQLICELPSVAFDRAVAATALIGEAGPNEWVFQDQRIIQVCLDPPQCSMFEEDFELGTLVCDDPLCTSFSRNRPVTSPGTISELAMAIQPPGIGSSTSSAFGVVQSQAIFQTLDIFYCADLACRSATERNLSRVTEDRLGLSVIARPGLDGAAMISFLAGRTGEIKIYDCDDRSCSTGIERTLATGATALAVGSATSLALNGSGNPVIVFYRERADGNQDVWSYVCSDPRCASGTEIPIDTSSATFVFTYPYSLFLRTDGRLQMYIVRAEPFPSTTTRSNIHVCNDEACSGWTVDPDALPGLYARSPAGETLVLLGVDIDVPLTLTRCADAACSAPSTSAVSTTLETIRFMRVLDTNRPVLFGSGSRTNSNIFVCAFPDCG